MRLIRLAQLMQLKYKVAGDETAADRLELALRGKIHSMWQVIEKDPILRECANSDPSKFKGVRQHMAKAGYLFTKEIVSDIDALYSGIDKLSLAEIRYFIIKIAKLIISNKNPSIDNVGRISKPEPGEQVSKIDFPHVSELIYEMIPTPNKAAVDRRNDQLSKVKITLSGIYSRCKAMLEVISKLEMMVPEKFKSSDVEGYAPDVDLEESLPGRFKPQRRMLSEHDVVDFIRQHGDEYGIHSFDDWRKVVDDPELREKMTTVINSLNRRSKQNEAAQEAEKIALRLKIQSLIAEKRNKETPTV